MSEDAVGVSTLSDISANMFAAFILILIMAAALIAQQGATGGAERVLAARDFQYVRRQALSPAALVQILYDRRPSAPGVGVDLHGGKIVVAQDGASIALGPDALKDGDLVGRLSTGRDPTNPIRLYVFANALYGATRRALLRSHSPWIEISVPSALRVGGDWSPAFKNLLSRTKGLADFRRKLARLLEAGDKSNVRSAPFGAGAALEKATQFESAMVALLHRMVDVAAILSAAAAIASIEWKTRRGG